MRNTNSTSATSMRLAPSRTVSPTGTIFSASSRPAMGPLTLMCFCPATLVAAIFQPASGRALSASTRACTA